MEILDYANGEKQMALISISVNWVPDIPAYILFASAVNVFTFLLIVCFTLVYLVESVGKEGVCLLCIDVDLIRIAGLFLHDTWKSVNCEACSLDLGLFGVVGFVLV
ncbi:hypothetical protein BDV38DRAFT_179364 [Aspergillus pseudotamarii]|uniref:Uncharacterized protein n=1 Tax=Aspergillus pseudotamarii TaxID=132259 RepID=A0A5N6SJ56_ASPPS|nr:uncharacterized protein BDV38DRAFT_179364 [Aspergillus pseudotamarii]KAE8133927.1 hypothetical protein BDV38DRAFT_179364 [Aspergillus pseudotamarii]